MRLELDTSDTRPEHMTRMLGVAAACGADTLRTYTKYDAPLDDVVRWTIRDLRAIAPVAADSGVLVVLENHEDFTGPVLAHILGEVDHPSMRALYDYGNSQMVGEDPLRRARGDGAVHRRVHAKDHVLLHGPDGPVVQGVPFGAGRLAVLGSDRPAVRRWRAPVLLRERVGVRGAPLKCDPAALPGRHVSSGTSRRGISMPTRWTRKRPCAANVSPSMTACACSDAMLAAGGYEVRSEAV